jgi:hypothetical protein
MDNMAIVAMIQGVSIPNSEENAKSAWLCRELFLNALTPLLRLLFLLQPTYFHPLHGILNPGPHCKA